MIKYKSCWFPYISLKYASVITAGQLQINQFPGHSSWQYEAWCLKPKQMNHLMPDEDIYGMVDIIISQNSFECDDCAHATHGIRLETISTTVARYGYTHYDERQIGLSADTSVSNLKMELMTCNENLNRIRYGKITKCPVHIQYDYE